MFDFAQAMARQNSDFRAQFGIGVREHSIYQTDTGSRFRPISSDAKALDGISVHFAVLDEIGSHKTKAVHDTLLTGMFKRRQPLMLLISTATDNVTGVGKQLWDYGEKILNGLEDERFFAVMYAADPSDDPFDEAVWQKAPGWGQMVMPDALRTLARQAKATPALKAAFMTRHLNIWVGADQALFDLRYWDRAAAPAMRIEEFLGQPYARGSRSAVFTNDPRFRAIQPASRPWPDLERASAGQDFTDQSRLAEMARLRSDLSLLV